MQNNLNKRLDPYYDPASWRDAVSEEQIRAWLGREKTCPACGHVHAIKTRLMTGRREMTEQAGELLHDMGMRGRCLVVMDEQTRQAAGEALLDGLSRFSAQPVVFKRTDLHADENALGTLMMALADRPDFLVSCGSGTLTDITRYNSYLAGVPFVAYATAASVDGYASASTPLLSGGYKRTYPGVAPLAILYDPDILAQSPQKMTAAGFGDILAKVIALIDWRLAWLTEDESYCPLVAGLVDRAIHACLDLAGDLTAISEPPAVTDQAQQAEKSRQESFRRKGDACSRLMEALSLTGIGMQMMGTSRPASGSEHQISHMLEMLDIQRKRQGSLHGDKVGIGTLIGMTIYMRLFAGGRMPKQRSTLDPERWRKEVIRVYGPLAETALAINEPQPPQGAVWEGQKQRLAAAMEAFGFAYVDKFRTLLPWARDQISRMGGPVRPDQLGYSRQDTYDAIAFGKENRPKFTTLRLAERFGWLYDLAEEIAEELPSGKIY